LVEPLRRFSTTFSRQQKTPLKAGFFIGRTRRITQNSLGCFDPAGFGAKRSIPRVWSNRCGASQPPSAANKKPRFQRGFLLVGPGGLLKTA
jgi:hypothetical protein